MTKLHAISLGAVLVGLPMLLLGHGAQAANTHYEGTLKSWASYSQEAEVNKTSIRVTMNQLSVKYKVSVLLGEPVFNYAVAWQAADSLRLGGTYGRIQSIADSPKEVQQAYAKIKPMNPTRIIIGALCDAGWVFLRADAGTYQPSGKGFGFNVAGSPSWNRTFLMAPFYNSLLEESDNYLEKEKAKSCFRSLQPVGFSIVAVENLTFSGLTEIIAAFDKHARQQAEQLKKAQEAQKNDAGNAPQKKSSDDDKGEGEGSQEDLFSGVLDEAEQSPDESDAFAALDDLMKDEFGAETHSADGSIDLVGDNIDDTHLVITHRPPKETLKGPQKCFRVKGKVVNDPLNKAYQVCTKAVLKGASRKNTRCVFSGVRKQQFTTEYCPLQSGPMQMCFELQDISTSRQDGTIKVLTRSPLCFRSCIGCKKPEPPPFKPLGPILTITKSAE